MIELPLTLRLAPRPVRPVAAWFAPGGDPAGWLAVLSEHFPTGDPELYAVPASRLDRTAGGLMILSAGAPPQQARGLIPLGRMGNLYLPTDAIVWPPVTEQELGAMLHLEINLLHPAVGLVGFSQKDAIRLPQLLAMPERRAVNWGLARPGFPPAARLVSVLPLAPPQVQEIIDEGRDDIGEKPLDEAPQQPDEFSASKVAKAMTKSPMAAIGSLLRKLAEKLRGKDKPQQAGDQTPQQREDRQPAGGSGGRSIGAGIGNLFAGMLAAGAKALENLSPRQFAALAGALEQHRNRELNRLLSLLDRNPDEGLRFALPLSGSASRGLTTPSGRLGARDINFNLSRVGRSGAADPWRLSWDMQKKLREKYRALATRELQLGRHRRAAYIFAQLLGDLSSAANALKQGGHFREAATLYRERLNNKRAAADCLTEGGLLVEAIPLYEELAMYERAGDLYTRLEQRVEAEAAYRKAVAQLIAAGNELTAAALLENRLHVPREALAVLDAAWPDRSNGAACLAESFRLLGRLRDFPEAQARVKRFQARVPPALEIASLTRVLAEVAGTFPETVTQHLAADTTKVLVGRQLAEATYVEAAELLRVVPGLAPADRLLPRDTQRYVQRLRPAPVTVRPIALEETPRRRLVRQLKVVRSFDLPKFIRWQTFAGTGDEFFGLGTGFSVQILIRCDFRGETGRREILPHHHPGPLGLVYSARPPTVGVLSLERGMISVSDPFPATDSVPEAGLSMDWLPSRPLAVACDEQQNIWVLHSEVEDQSELVLSAFDPETHALIATHALEGPDPAWRSATQRLVPMVVRANHVFIGMGPSVRVLTYGKKWHTIPFGRLVTHIVASHPLSRARVAVGLDTGGFVFTPTLDATPDGMPIAEGLDSPLMCFTRGGTLVAAAQSETRVYGFSEKRPDYRCTLPGMEIDARSPPGSLLQTPQMDEIAVISAAGQVLIINPGAS